MCRHISDDQILELDSTADQCTCCGLRMKDNVDDSCVHCLPHWV